MANATMLSAAKVLKEYYVDGVPLDVGYQDRPLFALLEKDESVEGKVLPLPLEYANPQGTSSQFSSAQGFQTPSQYGAFNLKMLQKYTVASVDGQLIKATKSNRGGFIKEAQHTIEKGYKSHSNQIHTELFQDGSGSMATVSNISGQVITLTSVYDTNRFEVGMTLVFSATLTGGTPTVTPVSIVSMSRGNAQLTVSGSLSGVSSGWFIYRTGDYGTTITGLKGWIPFVAPTAGDNFFGQDRSIDVERMAGNRLDAAGFNIQEALIQIVALIGIQGGNPDYAFLHPIKVAELQKALTTQVRYEEREIRKGDISISIKGFMLPHEYGEMMIVSDRKQDQNLGHILQLDTWKLYSMDKIGHLADDDGLGVLRVSNADAIEARIRSYPQLGCKAPAYNGVVRF